jgi:hypothetical protein
VNPDGSIARVSQIYDPIARLRGEDEVLIIASVGMKASRRYMILSPSGEPAWPHEPFGSLSDVCWSLCAHGWQHVTPEPIGPRAQTAKTLARLLAERA